MADSNYFGHPSVDGGSPFVRIGRYYTASGTVGENIAAGTQGDPILTMHQWLCDKATSGSTVCCPDRTTCDGHRVNILSASYHALGTGYGYSAGSTYKHYWTQDFGGVASGAFPPLVDGTHLLIGTTQTRFVANFYAAAGAQTVSVVIDGVESPLALDLGTTSHGTWFLQQPRGTGCRSYSFLATDAAGTTWRYPARGSLSTTGEAGCTTEFVP